MIGGMRYRLRTLVVAVALGPPAIAVAWMAAAGMRVHPVLLGAAFYLSLVLTLIAASWGLEAESKLLSSNPAGLFRAR